MNTRFTRFSTLLCGVCLASAARTADYTRVPEVVVSATRSEQSLLTTPASISIISRQEIDASGARTVTELLRNRGGVQVTDTFGDGSGAVVAMRGLVDSAASNTLILVDGRRLNNPDIRAPTLFNLSLEDIERIEIVQGSAGTLFGDQAVGGVINIITREPEGERLFTEARLGSYQSWYWTGGVSQRLDNGIALRFTGEHRRSDNYRDNNELTLRGLNGRVSYGHDTGQLFAEYRATLQESGTPGALFAEEVSADRRQVSANFANDFIHESSRALRLGLSQSLGENWSIEAELTRRGSLVDFLLSFRSGFPVTPGTQDRLVREFTPRLLGSYTLAFGELILSLGEDRSWSDYELHSSIGDQKNAQTISGTWVQAMVPVLPRTTLTLGARRARVENDLVDTFTFPGGAEIDDRVTVSELGLAFRPSDHWRLFLRRDENFRFAKVDEFTDPPPGVVLDTQTGVSLEAGAEWLAGGDRIKLLAYQLRLDDEIAVVPGVGAFNFPANTNIDETRRAGLILNVSKVLSRHLRLELDYNYIDGEIRSGPARGMRIPMVSDHAGRVQLGYQRDNWAIRGEIQAVSERIFSGDLTNILDELPGYAVLDLTGEAELGEFVVNLRVNNVLNKRYSDFGSKITLFPPPLFAAVQRESFFPSPERNLWLTVRWDTD